MKGNKNDCLTVCGCLNTVKGGFEMMYQLMLTLGEGSAKVLTVFKMYIYSDDPEIDWDSLEVWYKDVNIVDTLDLNDLESIGRQVNNSWDELERQYDDYH